MGNEFLTATGKPITIPAATRLPYPMYQAAQARADRDGVSMSTLFCRWIIEKLTEGEPPSGAAPVGGVKC